jgi:hypothetical protein
MHSRWMWSSDTPPGLAPNSVDKRITAAQPSTSALAAPPATGRLEKSNHGYRLAGADSPQHDRSRSRTGLPASTSGTLYSMPEAETAKSWN